MKRARTQQKANQRAVNEVWAEKEAAAGRRTITFLSPRPHLQTQPATVPTQVQSDQYHPTRSNPAGF